MNRVDSLLICNSNMFIPVVLTEILSNPDNQYLVISDISNIQQFFQLLHLPNVQFFQYGINYHEDGRFSFIKRKRECWSFLNQFEITKAVFFHAESGDMANWLLDKLSKKIPVKYCKIYDSIPAPRAKFSLEKLKLLVSQYVLWGQRMDILKDVYLFPSLPSSFFKKIKAETITLPIDNVLINRYLKDVLKSYNIKGSIVLLTGTVIKDKLYAEEEYVPFINALISSVGQNNIVSKCHPRYKDLYGLEQSLEQIPSFIPGNVLLNCFDCFIGVESTLLVEAAQAGKRAISIMDLLKPNEEVRKTLHEYFDNRLQGKGVIHFPKTLEEVIKIVNETLAR